MRFFIASLLAVWFGLVFFVGANGAFVRPPDEPPLPMLIGVTVPLVAFIVAYLGWVRSGRRFSPPTSGC